MLPLNGSVLPHQRRGRLGHFRLCGRIITNASNLPTSRNDMLTLLYDGVFLTRMELRKDPITRSWVITGDDVADQTPRAEAGCQFCPDSSTSSQQITSMAGIDGDPWSARAVVHPNPLYRIEGEPARRGEGIYDRMRSVGAHEVLLENPRHDRHLWVAGYAEIEQLLLLVAQRIQDLKRDARFKYVSGFERFALSRSGNLRDLAALLRRTLQRIRTVTEEFHLVLHTSPNTLHQSDSLNYWKTIDEDYHWHIEILPIVSAKAKSYTFKEVYYSPVTSETAVKRLREAKVEV